jgi:hypothetical protein
MKPLCFLAVLSFAFLSFGADIEMKLECFDVVQGELQMGATNEFAFTIQNTTAKPIRLLTNSSGAWLHTSPTWRPHVEGPVDQRCLKFGVVTVSQTPVGVLPHIEIPANGIYRLNYSGWGVANHGTYTLWVEYDGQGAPDGYYGGYAKTNKCTYTIKAPQGVDAEIFNLWQKQNPDRAACDFPLDMEPILTPQVLIEKYPTSIYSAWAIYKYLGAPEKWPADKLVELITQRLYPQSNSVPYSGVKGGWRSLKGDDMAQWQNEWAERILQNHPTFPYAKRLRLVMAINYLKLKQEQKGFDLLDGVAKTTGDDALWASKFIELWKSSKPKL